MKKYIILFVSFIIIILSITTIALYNNNNSLRDKLDLSISNEKAYALENSELKDNQIMFQFVIDQLEYFNDSLLLEMNNVRKELKIKDDEIKQLQYIASEAVKVDTIRLKDTVFIDNTVNIDTLIGDDWYSLRLGLKYPNLVTTNTSFKSEKFVVISNKKETINPPKKCKLARWFQKKHTVIEVEIVEKNPYIKNKQSKFIKIINKKNNE